MTTPEAAPALSTSSAHIFADDINPTSIRDFLVTSDEQLYVIYEIERTIREIKRERYKRIALQFPDDMLHHAPRVFDILRSRLAYDTHKIVASSLDASDDELAKQTQSLTVSEQIPETRLYILGDTSYGACCVDEIAAEHVDADAIVHYGRACLSPTARLPVIYVFTVQSPPNISKTVGDFADVFEDKDQKVILMTDLSYQSHLPDVVVALQGKGYTNIHEAEVKHDPSSPLPNRTVPGEVSSEASKLKEWHLFHISDPLESLLLTLSYRLASIYIYPTQSPTSSQPQKSFTASTSRALNRRYALLTSINTVSIFGILINTLSVKNYLNIVDHVKHQISAAGKKSYTFVVGKINAAKIANFSEIGAWVVIGCWESSLIDSKDFWKPVITPFELEMALKGDTERVWTGEWSSDYQRLLNGSGDSSETPDDPAIPLPTTTTKNKVSTPEENVDDNLEGDYDSEPESEPPDFDLRTGRYVSHSRPMQSHEATCTIFSNGGPGQGLQSNALLRRARGDVATVGGAPSPAAEFLQSKRTWKGLGSDFEIAYEEDGAVVEEGRSGIARGYAHREAEARV
ncbi:MAG: hypothetical protein Q9164_003297 [Protoblastenia rupestris]